MKVAKDLMTPQPYTVQSGADLTETVKWFVEAGLTSTPVMTPGGEVMGVLAEFGLLRAFLRHHLTPDKPEKVVHHKELFSAPVFVKETDPLADVIKAMVKSTTHRVLVLNNAEHLVGIISPKDILRFLVGEQKQTLDLKVELERARQRVKELSVEVSDLQGVLKKYERMYVDSPTMMHSVDADGVIVMANRKIHEVLGYAPNELVGKTLFDVYAPENHDEALKGLRAIQSEGYHLSSYSTMITKSGARLRVDLSSSALVDAQNRFIATITAARPVRSEELLRALHAALKDHAIEEKDLTALIQKLG